MMLKFLLTLICLIILPNFTSAAESFESAKTNLLCAMASLSAYSGDANILARDYLTGRGWKIDALTNGNANDVKAYMISRADENNRVTKILVVAGVENVQDLTAGLNTSRVPFDDKVGIFVHKGLLEYTDEKINGGVLRYIVDDLNKNPNTTLYLTGHGFGGSAALLTAARLVDAGIDSARLKVITFGMPAVGNDAFVDAYKNKIDLTRIVTENDVIGKAFTKHGYAHFGKVIEYKFVETQDHYAHEMVTYLDTAIRNYYDDGGFNAKMSFGDRISTPVYVAPISIVKKSFTADDEKYIRAMFIDSLKTRLSDVTFANPMFVSIKKSKNFFYDVTEFIAPAKKAGCKYIIVDLLHTKSIREAKQRSLRVILEESVFDLNGYPLALNTAGTTTTELTTIEAAISAQENLRQAREKVLADKKTVES